MRYALSIVVTSLAAPAVVTAEVSFAQSTAIDMAVQKMKRLRLNPSNMRLPMGGGRTFVLNNYYSFGNRFSSGCGHLAQTCRDARRCPLDTTSLSPTASRRATMPPDHLQSFCACARRIFRSRLRVVKRDLRVSSPVAVFPTLSADSHVSGILGRISPSVFRTHTCHPSRAIL